MKILLIYHKLIKISKFKFKMLNELEIKNDQTDLISDIQFSCVDNKFLSASWDNVIPIYE
jgi:hypothetical protein